MFKKLSFVAFNQDYHYYTDFLLCLNPNYKKFYYIDKLQLLLNESIANGGKMQGKCLIDQLLLVGDNERRFVEFSYNNGIIDVNSERFISPNNRYKEVTAYYLRAHPRYFKNSVLSKKEMFDIKKDRF